MNKKVSVIIEARLNSKRLPSKVLYKVQNMILIEYMIERLKQVNEVDDIIIATTTNPKDNKLVNLLKKKNILYFRGSENNVLKRVVDTAKKFNSKIIISLTGDCPLIDPTIIQKMLSIFKKNKYDLVSNSLLRSYPDGMDVNIFSIKSIIKCLNISKTKDEKEHTTLLFKKNRKLFKIKDVVASKKLFWPNLGLTLDEYKDYKLIKKICNFFYRKKQNYSCEDIVKLLKNKKKKWLKINKNIKRNIIE